MTNRPATRSTPAAEAETRTAPASAPSSPPHPRRLRQSTRVRLRCRAGLPDRVYRVIRHEGDVVELRPEGDRHAAPILAHPDDLALIPPPSRSKRRPPSINVLAAIAAQAPNPEAARAAVAQHLAGPARPAARAGAVDPAAGE